MADRTFGPPSPSEGLQQIKRVSSSTGRAAVSKTAGCRFESYLARHLDDVADGSVVTVANTKSRMNSKVERSKPANSASAGDIAKYALALALVIAGLVVWWWFADQWAKPLRALAVVAGLAFGALVFLGTAKGRDTREFLVESRFELRKVVWPTRQEAMRMTWVVGIVVLVLSLLLGGFDWIIQLALKQFFTLGR